MEKPPEVGEALLVENQAADKLAAAF